MERKTGAEPASPDMMRAAAANYFDRGVDGLYTWFLKWPPGDTERRIFTEIGDPNLVQEGVKHYFVRQRDTAPAAAGYTGDGSPATEAGLNSPRGLAFYGDDVLLIADHYNHRVRAVKLG